VPGGKRVERYDSLAQKVWIDTLHLYSTLKTGVIDKRVICDGSGGIIVSWLDYDGTIDDFDIYAQRVDSQGNRMWGDEGVLVGTQANAGTLRPLIAPDEQGGVVIGWEYPGSGLGFVSRISNDGIPLWGAEGISDSSSIFSVVSDLKGGAIYIRGNSYAQHVDSLGQKLGGTQGVQITTRNRESVIASISDAKGGILAYWTDFNIYCQWIDKDGNLGGKTDVEEGEQKPTIPNQFALYQNYPNPFNSSTLIKFSLKRSGFVELSIFNILGQKVIQLVNAKILAGGHQVIWDGKNENGESVASGVYFYSIRAGTYIETRKMTLLK